MKSFMKGKNIGVVSRCCQNQLAEAERLRHGLGHIAACQIHRDSLNALGAQRLGQLGSGLSGVAVDAVVGHQHALRLRAVGTHVS